MLRKVVYTASMKHKQQGFSHIVLVIVAVVVLGIGFTGYKVFSKSQQQSNTASSQKDQDNTADKKQADDVETSKLDTVPEATPVEQKPAETKPTTTTKPKTTTPAPDKPKARSITFTKGGGNQEGSVVRISANLSENQSGTCTYKFSLNGTIRVKETSGVSEGNKCFIEIPVSKFPKSATYSFALYFNTNDNLVTAYQSPYDITVQ